jgi:hypothetical protein
MNIYDIKRLTSETAPYFFSADTLRFFNQTMRSFKVRKQPDNRYRISATMRDFAGNNMGETVRYFNPINNELETK